MLDLSVSIIHISSDLWTSLYHHRLLAVYARWVNKHYQPRKALLAMPECRYSYSSDAQATLIMVTLEKYNIAPRIGYHTSDNATLNDTCLSYLSIYLREKYNISYYYYIRLGLYF